MASSGRTVGRLEQMLAVFSSTTDHQAVWTLSHVGSWVSAALRMVKMRMMEMTQTLGGSMGLEIGVYGETGGSDLQEAEEEDAQQQNLLAPRERQGQHRGEREQEDHKARG